MISIFQGGYIPDLHDLHDLHDLAHVAGREPHNLHDRYKNVVSWAGPVQHASSTDDLDHDLPVRRENTLSILMSEASVYFRGFGMSFGRENRGSVL